MKSLLFALVVLAATTANALSAREYVKRPKLVVVLVIDQFRGDYLTRFEKKFLSAGTMKEPGGFRFLMEQGAWFPFAEYDISQAMTCTGHAMILSGSHPASTGIGTNEWFDPLEKKLVYCADDAEFGLSPRRLRTTTVGDELKNVHPKSKVITLSMKDRSAIMLGGHRADTVLWLGGNPGQWTTSNYYNKGHLPAWAKKLNEDGTKKEKMASPGEAYSLASGIEGVETILKAGITAVAAEKLGRGSQTDLLAISLSNHDLLGHRFGPTSDEMEKMTLAEDRLIGDFLKKLRSELGSLEDVTLVLTGDHGVQPLVDPKYSFQGESGRFDYLAMIKRVGERLDKKFGSSKQPWILNITFFQVYLNRELIKAKGRSLAEVAAEVKQILLEEKGVLHVFTRQEFDTGNFPPDPIGKQLKNSYVPGQSGDVTIVAKPAFIEDGHNNVNHMTGWSYDRAVPIIFVGRAFKPGVYPGGLVVDLAPTLSFVMGILPPAMSEGRVLGESLSSK